MRSSLTATLLITLLPLLFACNRGESQYKGTVNTYLNARYLVPLETGMVVVDAKRANALQAAAADDLIGFRQIPQSYWNSFMAQTQGTGTPYEITPKKKLLDAAEPSHADEGNNASHRIVRVRVASAAVTEILSAKEYTGSLADATGKHTLVLGRFEYKRLPGQATLGWYLGRMSHELAIPVIDLTPDSDWKDGRHIYNFRTILKYSEFTKQWSVVAFDAAAGDHWFSQNVK